MRRNGSLTCSRLRTTAQATLITLTYDGLVEAAVCTLKLPLGGRPEEVVVPADVLDDFSLGVASGLSSYVARAWRIRDPLQGARLAVFSSSMGP